jgi:putative membrane protein
MTTFLFGSLLASHGEQWDHAWWPLWPLLWLAVIATVVWLVRGRHWARPPRSGADRARDILAERFARGEITGEEYRERLEQLHS